LLHRLLIAHRLLVTQPLTERTASRLRIDARGTTMKKINSSIGMTPPILMPTVRSGSMLQCPVMMAQMSQMTKSVNGMAKDSRSRFQRRSTRVRSAISSQADPMKMNRSTPR
jgi:hypothetical protein